MAGRARPNDPLAAWCEIQTVVCEGRATERHHRLRRSQGGGDEWENTLDLCRSCHLWVHQHPQWAYEHGHLIRSGQRPEEGN